ncbi:Glc operon transcriptional activator [mine drainage metagenome]|uniref:Glc operon transcriptional activator n=1 Tax=mine drainage metagenome TaxID=410659 RepID=A0A1J5S2V1_9ZZZZ
MTDPMPLHKIAMPQINRVSASDHIADALRGAIVDGLIPVGEPLKQDEIAARFQVSKIPVREALKRLEAEGLVTFIQNRGAVVAIMSTEEIGEYLDIRAVLEGKAAELSAPNITPGTLELAADYLDKFRQETSPREWANLNWYFHATLYRDANRPILMTELRTLYNKLERYIRTLLALNHAETPKTHCEHAAILDAFARRDAKAAAELTRSHVLDGGATLIKHLNNHRRIGE